MWLARSFSAALLAVLSVFPAPVGAETPWRLYADLDYDIDSPPGQAGANTLDLYVPRDEAAAARPVVVYVHGGAWAIGDKSRVWHKPDLFVAQQGYILASINYRLSPYPPAPVVPGRVMFPDHPHDVGEAIAWLYRNVASYGGDPTKMVLVGHSAGAHLVALVASDPSYLDAYDVPTEIIRGVVALDAGAYDIPRSLQGAEPAGKVVYWNAFGNPVEEQLEPRWAAASPVRHAGSEDPSFMLVTQEGEEEREGQARAFAEALGQDPDSVVHVYPKTHEEINRDLGSPEDATTYTEDVRAFVTALLA